MTGTPTAPAGPYVGKVLSGKYAILDVLGEGGMGTVYLAENVSIGRRVALKVLIPELARHAEIVERFAREARAAAKIGHPNIVDVLDMGRTDDGLSYIVMEVLEGENLGERLSGSAPLTTSLALDVLTQMLGALGAAHAAGIVHRDLKPENVFLTRRGMRTDFVKVFDFGVAMFHDATGDTTGRLTHEGSVVGTPAYMSPEQAAGSTEVDARSDLYAVGVIGYEMLSGRLPYAGRNYNEIITLIASTDPAPLRDVAPWIPPDLAAVVTRSMARDPAERFQTAEELAAALEPFIAAIELEVPEMAVPMRTPPTARFSGPPTLGALPAARGAPTPGSTPATLTASAPTMPAERRRSVGWIALAGVVVAAGALLVYSRANGRSADAEVERPSENETPSSEPPARPAAEEPESEVSPTAPAPMLSMDVTSNVEGARVSLNGRELGATPLHTMVPQAEGTHVLQVEAEGYESAERLIPLEAPVRIVVGLLRSAASEEARPARRERREKRGGRGGRQKKGRGLIFDEDVY